MFEELLDIADDGSNDYYERQIGGPDGHTIEVPDTEGSRPWKPEILDVQKIR